jgi:Uma2 family endonuclease
VLALVEVSDTTVEFDRTVKVPLYAQDGIAEVWIVDLKAGAVEVYQEPSGDGYQQVQAFRRGDVLNFGAFDDVPFTVDQLLG